MDSRTFDLLAFKAETGDPVAQFQMYELYSQGDDELYDDEDSRFEGFDMEEAIRWLERSADLGYPPAIGELGCEMIEGGYNMAKGTLGESHEAEGLQKEFEAADQAYLPSMFRVGKYLFSGKTSTVDYPGEFVEQNPERAFEYWSNAARQGNLDSCLACAKAQIIGVGAPEVDYRNTKEILEVVIDAADPEENQGVLSEARFWLGFLYYYGLGVGVDEDLANDLFVQSQSGGFMPADDVCNESMNPREALLNWDYPYDYDSWRKLFPVCPFIEADDKYDNYDEETKVLAHKALNGDAASLVEINRLIVEQGYSCNLYEWLLDVERNETEENDELYNEGRDLFDESHYVEAVDKLLIPAFNGYSEAMCLLARCYADYYWNGDDESDVEDPEWSDEFCVKNSFKWFLIASCNEDFYAQYKLGEHCYYGRIPNAEGEVDWREDYPSAAFWFDEASIEIGDAANFLGTMYSDGLVGDGPDPEKAVEWYRKATELKYYNNGWYNLGLCYENGKGVEQDFKKAMDCYYRIADHNTMASIRYAVLEYNNYPNDNDRRSDAVRRFKEAASDGYSEAKDILDQIGIGY